MIDHVAPRSALYMPASSSRLLAKGPSLPADAIIIDLEDAVAPDLKADARAAAVEALNTLDYGKRLRVLRINGEDSYWHDEDIVAAVACTPDAVLLPKADDGAQIERFVQRLDAAGVSPDVAVWVMLESPHCVVAARSIAEAGRDLQRFTTVCIGNNDLSLAAGLAVPAPRQLLQPWLMSLLAAARAGGVLILDGVYNDFKDEQGFDEDCRASAATGMDGRTLIHPKQIPTAHRHFSPSEQEISEANAIIEAFDDPANADRGVLQIDGRMYEKLHLIRAQQTVSRARRLDET